MSERLPSAMADYIDAYLTHLRNRGRSDSTIDTYGWLLCRIDRDLPYGLASANTDELQTWIHVEGRKPAAVSLYRTIVSEFFKWACDPRDPLLDWNPTLYLPDRQRLPRRIPRPLTIEQLTNILTRAREPYRTWFVLAAYAGLRCVEIANLDTEHVSRDTIWIHGKGSHQRIIPTDPYVWEAVSTLPAGAVARRADSARASRHHISMAGAMYLHRSLKLPDVSMHRFRHTFATNVYQQTGDIHLVRQLMGHASVATTQVYAQIASPAMVAAIATLPRFTTPNAADATAA